MRTSTHSFFHVARKSNNFMNRNVKKKDILGQTHEYQMKHLLFKKTKQKQLIMIINGQTSECIGRFTN